MTSLKNGAPILEQVKKAIKEFEAAQQKHKAVGAYDTEPDTVWQALLMSAMTGSAPTPPRTAEKWELYASSCDCADAVQDLFDAALKAIQTIESCPIRDIASLREYLNHYCWRMGY